MAIRTLQICQCAVGVEPETIFRDISSDPIKSAILSDTIVCQKNSEETKEQTMHSDTQRDLAEDTCKRNATRGPECFLQNCDARTLDNAFPQGYFSAAVTNPPYGVRFGKHINFMWFYLGTISSQV